MSNHITGAFVRVERDGTWQNLDIAELTEEEVNQFFDGMEATRLLAWVKGLVGWMRTHLYAPEDALPDGVIECPMCGARYAGEDEEPSAEEMEAVPKPGMDF